MRSSICAPALALFALPALASAQSLLRAPRFELPADHAFENAGDLDGDGALDAIVRGPDGWYPLLDVAGAKLAGATLPLLDAPTTSALGDVTGDGAPDLLARYNELPSGGASGLRLFVGLGDGGFAPPIDLAGPGLSWNFTLADVNGDGVLDPVSFDTETILGVGYEHTVNAWNLTGPSPQAAPPLLLPTFVGELAAFDRDGDGDMEVAFARANFEPGSDDLYLVDWSASGVPSLTAALEVTTYIGSANSLVAADADGDGDADLIFTQYDTAGDDGYVLENQNGTLLVGPLQDDLGGNAWGTRSVAADWDQDGDDDLIYWDYNSQFDSAYVYLTAAEDLGLTAAAYWSWPGAAIAPDLAAVVDVNGDGWLDVLAGPCVMYGNGLFEPIGAAIATEGCCVGLGSPATDVDGDGDLDLDGHRFVLHNDGTGKGPVLPAFEQFLPNDELLESVWARGDFDGDGFGDLLVEWGVFDQSFPFAQFEFLGTRLLRGQADGTYVDGGIAAPGVALIGQYYESLEGADFDSDGDVDVLGFQGWYPNNGSGQFGAKVNAFVGEPRLIADLDEDGDPDLLCRQTFGNTSTWHFWRNDGSGAFSEAQVFQVLVDMGELPLLFDYDRDGRDDLCFAVSKGVGTGGIHVAFHQGAGAYSAPQLVQSAAAGYERLASGDVNADGWPDLLAMRDTQGSLGTRLDLYLGTSVPESFALESYYGPNSTQLADLDGDGDDDVLSHLVIESLAFDEPSSGSIRQYGFGFGGGPVAPLLGAQGPFQPQSTTAELRISHGIGGAAYFVYWGTSEVALLDVPVVGAGIFIAPIHLIYSGVLGGTPGAEGEGSVAIDKTPWVSAIPGFVVPHQALLLHPGYPTGFALTNALTLSYGF